MVALFISVHLDLCLGSPQVFKISNKIHLISLIKHFQTKILFSYSKKMIIFASYNFSVKR